VKATRRQTAQALAWFTMALPLLLSVAGLAVDGGVLLASRRHLQSVADGAARAGATQLDLGRLRSSAGAEIVLDQRLATQAARAYLDGDVAWPAGNHDPASSTVTVSDRTVHVVIQTTLRTAFLRIVHIDSFPVQANADATLQAGIHDGGGD
jgi:Flp pilus assembly protein TadG